MYRNFKAVLYKALLSIMTLAAVVCLTGCWTDKWVELQPAKHVQPITMFDRYRLDFIGYLVDEEVVYIEVSFLEPTGDISHLDTVPVFIIDSMCFPGDCLDVAFCNKTMSWYDAYKGRGPMSPDYTLLRRKNDFGDPDLLYGKGKLVPSGFYDKSAAPVRVTCPDSTVFVQIKARLLDRLTGKEISRETKTVPFKVKRKQKRIILSQTMSSPREVIPWAADVLVCPLPGLQSTPGAPPLAEGLD